MASIRARIAKLTERLVSKKALLAQARRRYKANRRRAFKAHNQQLAAQARADKLRAQGHPAQAEAEDRNALRLNHVAYKNHMRAQYWLGKVKVLVRHAHKLDDLLQKAEIERTAWQKKHGVEVNGNKVTGGTPRQRLRAAIHAAAHNCATGKQNNYYSMSGASPDHSHTIQEMPYGHRFDCSSFADGIYECCGLPNPSGTTDGSGYTGTEGSHGKQVSRAKAQTGDLILYGPYPHHHVEVVDDPARETTIGHGSAPIDAGIWNLFGDDSYSIRSYL